MKADGAHVIIYRYLAKTLLLLVRINRRIKMKIMRFAFRKCGKNVFFDPGSLIKYENVEIGNDVFIGPGANLAASNSKIIFGNKIMLGPNVTIISGNHNTSLIGEYMYDVKEKRLEDDQDIVIEDDIWIGSRAIILKGVHLCRGCIVAAGSVVTHNAPPYTVIAGIPAKVISLRFSIENILRHEKELYSAENRFSEEYLLAELSHYTESLIKID